MSTSILLLAVAAAALVAGVGLLMGDGRASLLRRREPVARPMPAVKPVSLVGLLGGAVAGWAILGSVLGAAGGGVVGFVGASWLGRRPAAADVRGRQQMATEFPLVLGFLASVVDSGAPVRFAAQAVSDVTDERNAQRLRGVLARCDVGFTDAEAWRTLVDDPVWGDVARELARCVETGAATAEVLRAAAEQSDKTAAAQAMTKARGVGVSSTLPLVCCFLPAFLLLGVAPIIGGLISGYIG